MYALQNFCNYSIASGDVRVSPELFTLFHHLPHSSHQSKLKSNMANGTF